jgi:hypothetical protein
VNCSIILENADKKINNFDDNGLHYNLVADAIYKKLKELEDPFQRSYLQYIIAGLISFDIGRMMGKKSYSSEENGFASRLYSKLQDIKPLLEPLAKLTLPSIDLKEHGEAIRCAYQTLSDSGPNALNENQNNAFPVGATKILHFINPELFIIVDSNAARAFRKAWDVPFENSTQPGYSPDRYLECMEDAQKDIRNYGVEKFQNLARETPLARIYDKLTFITGSELKGA